MGGKTLSRLDVYLRDMTPSLMFEIEWILVLPSLPAESFTTNFGHLYSHWFVFEDQGGFPSLKKFYRVAMHRLPLWFWSFHPAYYWFRIGKQPIFTWKNYFCERPSTLVASDRLFLRPGSGGVKWLQRSQDFVDWRTRPISCTNHKEVAAFGIGVHKTSCVIVRRPSFFSQIRDFPFKNQVF